MAFDVGDLVRSNATFVASGGLLADPSQVWFLVQPPGTAVATHRYGLAPSQVVKAGVGAYYIDLDVTMYGGWRFRWEGTGNNLQVAEEGDFEVQKTFKL